MFFKNLFFFSKLFFLVTLVGFHTHEGWTNKIPPLFSEIGSNKDLFTINLNMLGGRQIFDPCYRVDPEEVVSTLMAEGKTMRNWFSVLCVTRHREPNEAFSSTLLTPFDSQRN